MLGVVQLDATLTVSFFLTGRVPIVKLRVAELPGEKTIVYGQEPDGELRMLGLSVLTTRVPPSRGTSITLIVHVTLLEPPVTLVRLTLMTIGILSGDDFRC